VPCNVGHKDQLAALVGETRRQFGPIDIWSATPRSTLLRAARRDPDDAYDRTMATNVRSNLWLCQMVLPDMAARRDGAIVIISSIAG